MMGSLRWRLFLGICGVTVVVVGALSFALDAAVHHTLQAEFDAVLLEKARTLDSLVEQSGKVTHFDYQAEQFPEFRAGPKAAYFEIYLDGKSYQRSESLGANHLPADDTFKHATSYTLPDGRQGRLLIVHFEPLVETDDPAAGPPPKVLPQGIVVVAQDSSALDRTLDRLRWTFVGMGAVAVLLSGLLLAWVAGLTIRPLGRLSRQIGEVKETDLAREIRAADFPTELVPVVERLNGLLARLEGAFARERSFTADVAHELRTPLTGILATLEVARSRPRDAAEYTAAIDKSLGILRQMQGLVENLLLLARAESGQLPVRHEQVNLAELVQEGIATHAEAAARRGLQVHFEEASVPTVASDPEILRVALFNLVDNAVSYAPGGGRIDIRVCSQGRGARVEIANACATLTEADLPRLFERFVRKDAARSGGMHAGLGLSICRRLAGLAGGTVALKLEQGQFIASLEVLAAAGEST